MQASWKMAWALIFVLGAGTAHAETLWTEKSPAEAHQDAVRLPSLAPLIERAGAAVVHISTAGKEPKQGQAMDPFMELFKRFNGGQMPRVPVPHGLGTGFIIHPSGYIATNAHVVEDAEKIEVRLRDDRQPHAAKLIGADPTTDLALIKIEAHGLPVLPLGNSDELNVGDLVVAIGNPFGLDHSASFGMVSAKGRRDINPSGRSGLYDFIQTDAAINPGNSGGPLINLAGEVVGINAAVNSAGQGIGFAIPINMAKSLLPQLKENGGVTRSWLGVSIQEVTPELAQSFGLDSPTGALVSEVIDGSPAARAGVEPGDVVVGFDHKKVTTNTDLPLLAATAGVGKKVDLEVIRDGKALRLGVTLGERPNDNVLARASPGTDRGGRHAADVLGMEVSDLDGDARRQLGLPSGFKGVVISEVKADSAAAAVGLRRGDIIVKLNGRNVGNARAFARSAQGIREGSMVRLFVRRGNNGLFLAFRK